MNQEKYIGMDVHQATISVAVMDGQDLTRVMSRIEALYRSCLIAPNGWPRL
jgi:hypothetical protein